MSAKSRIEQIQCNTPGHLAVRTSVAGTSFANRQKYLAGLASLERANKKNTARITLSREYNNKFDANAIRVYVHFASGAHVQVGYLPRELAAILAPIMDNKRPVERGRNWIAIIDWQTTGRMGKNMCKGLTLSIRWEEKAPVRLMAPEMAQ